VGKLALIDGAGRVIQTYTENLRAGSNTFTYNEVAGLPTGMYYIRVVIGEMMITKKFTVVK
jgi:hypothetical protein